MPPPSRFLSLPIELQIDILDLLPFPCLQVLHNTHPYFRTLVNLDKIRSTTHTHELLYQGYYYALEETQRTGNRHKTCGECFSVKHVEGYKEDRKLTWQLKVSDYYLCSKCCADRPGLPEPWCRVCAATKPAVVFKAEKELPDLYSSDYMAAKEASDRRVVLRMGGRYCCNPLSEYDLAMEDSPFFSLLHPSGDLFAWIDNLGLEQQSWRGRWCEKLRKEQDRKDRERIEHESRV